MDELPTLMEANPDLAVYVENGFGWADRVLDLPERKQPRGFWKGLTARFLHKPLRSHGSMQTPQGTATMTSHVARTRAGTRHPSVHGLLAAAVVASLLTCAGTARAQASSPSASPPITATGINDGFDPTHYDIVPPKSFEELKVGEVYRMPSRTLTNALTSAFQAVSLDNNPLHYDDEYAKRRGLPGALIQPMKVLAFAAPGASLFTLYIGDELIAFTGLNCKFLKPSFVGDTLYPALEIVQLSKAEGHGVVTVAIAVHNQKGELVLTGQQVFTLKLSTK